MTRTTQLIPTLVIAAGLAAAPAFAQEAIVAEQGSSDLRGDWVLGSRINSTEGEAVGSIEDLIIDQDEGNITAAIISVGGFLGFGAKQIAVEWSELQINWDANEIEIELTREEAEAAPEYEYRTREYEPAPATDTGTGTGTGMGTGTGTGTGTTGGTTGGDNL